ncbi:AAA domain-containing protein [Thermosulfurimonas marina]|uniref:AAA domain-containing protein n=1 Tax=Thermosulfurimonas marina TaxID=2047767 RepID=A0A6H1WUN2_9BACT|nr:sigma-54-dependent Fis family transcriptional regulator [Thermosulfurimonas marina]QJA06864.1 AAA domain-containing protein [Thermosulfurimonas marina]
MAIVFWTPSGRLRELAEDLAREHSVRLLSDLLADLPREDSPEILVAEVSGEGPSFRQILDVVRHHHPGLPVLLLAERAGVEEAVEAIRAGAYDFRLLSTDRDLLRKLILAALEERRLLSGEEGFLTRDPALRALLERLRPVAASPAPVLIVGESGTGKEVLARWLHQVSPRARGPFVAINCAALPEALLESELFGYEKGAFSGALTRKKGKFELADGGTILLDEITEMPLPLQAKLLRVLQEGEVDRLGGAYPVKVDVRVIATTNREIEEEVRAGRFREDLYFRLNVIPVRLPPLRERRADIPYLAEHFLREFARRYGKEIRGFSREVLEIFEGYDFPGNVRELKNLVERAVLLARGPEITPEDLLWESPLSPTVPREESPPPIRPLRELEKEAILAALKACGGNRTRAAEILGISVRTLRNKLKAFRAQGLL